MYGCGKRVERQKLYEEVWITPMMQLARTYGISDRGLAKICGRLRVPVPPRGYWRRKETGQDVEQETLPPLKEGQPAFLYYNPTIRTDISPKEKELVEFEKRSHNLVTVGRPGTELHPLAASVGKNLRHAKKDESGILTNQEGWCSAIKVSKIMVERALLVLDAIFRALDARGYKAVWNDEKKRSLVSIEGGEVTFVLEEVLDRKVRELTKAQLKDKEKNPWLYRRPEYFYVPSGRLSLRLTSSHLY